jgi:hypothetical protein
MEGEKYQWHNKGKVYYDMRIYNFLPNLKFFQRRRTIFGRAMDKLGDRCSEQIHPEWSSNLSSGHRPASRGYVYFLVCFFVHRR